MNELWPGQEEIMEDAPTEVIIRRPARLKPIAPKAPAFRSAKRSFTLEEIMHLTREDLDGLTREELYEIEDIQDAEILRIEESIAALQQPRLERELASAQFDLQMAEHNARINQECRDRGEPTPSERRARVEADANTIAGWIFAFIVCILIAPFFPFPLILLIGGTVLHFIFKAFES